MSEKGQYSHIPSYMQPGPCTFSLGLLSSWRRHQWCNVALGSGGTVKYTPGIHKCQNTVCITMRYDFIISYVINNHFSLHLNNSKVKSIITQYMLQSNLSVMAACTYLICQHSVMPDGVPLLCGKS